MTTSPTITYSFDLTQSLLWRHNQAVNLQGLTYAKQNWYNENYTQFWENWFADVFNLATANNFGLSVWSIILNLPLFLLPDPDADKPIWGFDDDYYFNFDNGYFTSGSNAIILTTEQQRLILQLRYFQLSCKSSWLTVNKFLKYLFEPYGPVYMLDTYYMSINYIFTFTVDPQFLAALKAYDVLPRGAGVGIRYVDTTRPTWGFDDPYYFNFDNATFIEDDNA